MSKHVENARRKGLIGSFARLVGLEGKGVLRVEGTPEGPSEVPAKVLRWGNETIPHHDSLPMPENGGGNGPLIPVLPLVGGGGESPLTMSSREIAELTGKEHKNVVRDIEKMLVAVEEDRLKFERIYQDRYGRDQKEYALTQDLTYNLVLGYDAARRLKIVRRWMELEAAAKAPSNHFPVPHTHAGALRLAADLAEQVEQQRAELVVAQPKAVVYDTVVATSTTDLQTAIRTFDGVNSMKIASDLVRLGYLYTVGRHSAKRYRVRAEYRGKLFDEKFDPNGQARKIQVLDEGWKVLAELYRSGELTMKRDFRGDLRVH